MSKQAPAILHADHRHWQNDIKMWRQDIEEWQKEQAKLLAGLETDLGAEVSGLMEHASSIGRHEENVICHEHLIATVECSPAPPANEIEARAADAHQKEAEKHENMRRIHERLKWHHHRAMARLAVVLKALSEEV